MLYESVLSTNITFMLVRTMFNFFFEKVFKILIVSMLC